LRRALVRMREAHRRTLYNCRPAWPYSTPRCGCVLQLFLSRPVGSGPARFFWHHPTISSVLDRLRAAAKVQGQPDFPGLERNLHDAYRAGRPVKGHLVLCRDGPRV